MNQIKFSALFAPFVVFVLAFGLRLHYNLTNDHFIWGDENAYIGAVQYSDDQPILQNAFFWRLTGGFRSLVPMAIKGIYKYFGEDLNYFRYFQTLIGSLTCVAVYLLGNFLSNRRVGFIAGLLVAIFPPFILYTGYALSETLGFFCLWVGIYLYFVGIRRENSLLLAISGIFMLGAVTFRIVLTPIIVLLWVIIPFTSRAKLPKRALLFAVFCVSAIGGYVAFNRFVASFTVKNESTFSAGVAFVSGTVLRYEPYIEGWAPDVQVKLTPEESQLTELLKMPLHTLTTGGNYMFYALWFADTPRNDTYIVTPDQTVLYQRILVLVALIGFGLCLPKLREHLPFMMVFGTWVFVCLVTYIEPREQTFIIPLFGFYVGVVIDRWLQLPARERQLTGIIGVMGIITIIAFYVLKFPASLTQSGLPIMAIGTLIDIIMVVTVLDIAFIAYRLLEMPANRMRVIMASVAPILFGLLMLAHLNIQTNLRWQEWTAQPNELGAIEQIIHFDEPLKAEEIESVRILVDLAEKPQKPMVKITVNDQALLRPWYQLFCPLNVDPFCDIYRSMTSWRNGAKVTAFEQWWGMPLDISAVANRESITIGFPSTSQFKLRGNFDGVDNNRYVGASVKATNVSTATSIYRLAVMGNWRIVLENELDSQATTSTYQDGQPIEGSYYIRLMITFKDGTVRYY